jgi:hypothetical protein
MGLVMGPYSANDAFQVMPELTIIMVIMGHYGHYGLTQMTIIMAIMMPELTIIMAIMIKCAHPCLSGWQYSSSKSLFMLTFLRLSA